MSEQTVIFPLPVNDITQIKFSARTGELELDISIPHPTDGDTPLRLLLSPEVTQQLALTLARTHKFLDEQLEGISVTNVLQ